MCLGGVLLTAELAYSVASLERGVPRLREVAAVSIVAHNSFLVFTSMNLLGPVAVRQVFRTVYQNGQDQFFDGHQRTLSDIWDIACGGDLMRCVVRHGGGVIWWDIVGHCGTFHAVLLGRCSAVCSRAWGYDRTHVHIGQIRVGRDESLSLTGRQSATTRPPVIPSGARNLKSLPEVKAPLQRQVLPSRV